MGLLDNSSSRRPGRLVPVLAAASLLVLSACTSSAAEEKTAHPGSASGSGDRILYEWYGERPRKDIFVWDGQTSRALAADVESSTSHVHAAWSPDGSRIAFESLDDSGADSIWVMDADGTHVEELVTCQTEACRQYAYPSWSRRGDQLAVVRFDVLPSGDWGANAVEVIDLESGIRRVVAEFPDAYRSFSETPSWSPDDNRLVVQVDFFDDTDLIGERLAVVPTRGTHHQMSWITPPRTWASYPDWHPTRPLIVFNDHDLGMFQSMDQRSGLWLVRPDGSGLRRLTHAKDTKYAQPAWSPDGRRLIFSIARGDTDVSSVDLATMPSSGGRATLLGIQGAHARFDPSS